MKIISSGPDTYYGRIYVECDEISLLYYLVIPTHTGDDRQQISAYLAMAWKDQFPLLESEMEEDDD